MALVRVKPLRCGKVSEAIKPMMATTASNSRRVKPEIERVELPPRQRRTVPRKFAPLIPRGARRAPVPPTPTMRMRDGFCRKKMTGKGPVISSHSTWSGRGLAAAIVGSVVIVGKSPIPVSHINTVAVLFPHDELGPQIVGAHVVTVRGGGVVMPEIGQRRDGQRLVRRQCGGVAR